MTEMDPELEAEVRDVFKQTILTEKISDLLEITEALHAFVDAMMTHEEHESLMQPLLDHVDAVLADPDPNKDHFVEWMRTWIMSTFHSLEHYLADHKLPHFTMWVKHSAVTGFTMSYFRQWQITPNGVEQSGE